MRTFIPAVIVLVFCGCATEGKLREQLAEWEGKKIDRFIMRFGPPETQAELSNGNKMLQWTVNRGTVAWGTANRYTASTYGMEVGCHIRFIVDKENTVQEWSFEGNNCKAK